MTETPRVDAAEIEYMKTPARDHPYERLLALARDLEKECAAATALYVAAVEARHGLEKDAARYRFLAEQHNGWHVERWIDTMRGSGTWQSIRGTTLDNAIDAAINA